jgi:hypothetical protein
MTVLAGNRVRASDPNGLDTRITALEAGPGGLQVGCILRRAATQSINNSATTSATFDTEDVDTHSFSTASVSPSATVTIPTGKGGFFGITFNALPASAPATRQDVQLAVTAARTGFPTVLRNPGGAGSDRMSGSWCLPLQAGDTFTCQVFQTSGGALNYTFWVCVARIGVFA